MASMRLVLDDDAVDALLSDVDGPTGRHLGDLGDRVLGLAQALAAVDTGQMRRSWEVEVGNDAGRLECRVGVSNVARTDLRSVRAGTTNVDVTLWQEFGTRYQEGTPALRPALAALSP